LIETAKVIVQTIKTIDHQFAQTYSLMKSIKEFGERSCQAAQEKMKQLHNHIVFKPILIEKLLSI
jgi:hypothetical protein